MSELIQNLGIDWKVLLAQLINFAIVLFVLKRFLYKPLINMLEKRRSDIEQANARTLEIDSRLKDVENAKEEVLNEARQKSTDIIKAAEASASKLEQKILNDAREEASKVANEERKKLSQEREKLVQDVKKEIGQVVALAVEKSMAGALDEKAQKNLVETAVSEARNLKK